MRVTCQPIDCVRGALFNPFSIAVSIRGQTALIPSGLPPKRDWGPKRVNAAYNQAKTAMTMRFDCGGARGVRIWWCI